MGSFGIMGNGFVGNAIYEGMKSHYDIKVFDIDKSKANCSFDELNNEQIIFVCVPTPMTKEGYFDVAILNSAITRLSPGKTVVIKSTILPDNAEGLVECFPEHHLVFNPEFLTERTAVKDFKNPSRIVLGGDKESVEKIEQLYRVVFPSRLIPIIKTDYKTACFIKYFCNCFFACKVSLMNEFKQIANANSVDWRAAMEGLLSSGWVNHMHTQVPGPDGDYGFGGKCFPKDINALITHCKNKGITPTMLEAAWTKNTEVRSNLNWFQIEGAVSHKKEKK